MISWFHFDLITTLPLIIRCSLSFGCSLLFVILLTPRFIHYLHQLHYDQNIYELLPVSHQSKRGTPTMGGVLIALSTLLNSLLWAKWNNELKLLLFTLVSFASIGLFDDWLKIKHRSRCGLSASHKFLIQLLTSILILTIIYKLEPASVRYTYLPFIGLLFPVAWWLWWLIGLGVITGSSNAVNLTDGLDGLALSTVTTVLATLGLLAYWTSQPHLAPKFGLYPVPEASEICIFLCALVGSGLGLLKFNAYPARIFIGDTGSLLLGAVMAVVTLLLHQPLILLVLGGIFVIETLSVILQVVSYRLTGHRIFRMTPIHHHFELLGMREPHIVLMAWLVTLLLSLFTLKFG